MSMVKYSCQVACRFSGIPAGNLGGIWEVLVVGCKGGLCPFPSVVRFLFFDILTKAC